MAVPVNQAVVTVREIGSSSSYLCPTLTQTNYTSWAIKMQSFMDAQGIWDAIELLEGVAVDAKLGKKTRASSSRPCQKIYCYRLRKTRRLKDSESIDDFAGKIGSIVSKFQTLGANIEEKVKVEKVLNPDPSRFLPIVATIEQYSDQNTMPFEELIGCLKTYEERVKPAEPVKDSTGQLLLTRSEWHARQKQESKQRSSGPRNSRGHWRGRGRSSRGRGGRQPSNNDRRDNHADQRNRDDKKPMWCFNCNRIGHFSADCRAPRRAEEEANLVREDDEPTLLMAKCSQEMVMLNKEKVFPSIYAKEENNEGMWYLDNGVSNHMTGNREQFCELNEKTVGQVRFGDESAIEIKGKGSILLQCKNGDQRLVTNVYYIPSLCNNILSFGQFDEGGNKIVINNGVLWMYERSGATLMKVKRGPNRLYKIKLQTVLPTCFLSKMDDTAWFWHARLGHINFETLRRMTKEGMANGLPIIDHKSELCEACLAGKHRRSPFLAHSTHQAEKPLELIHADLCGPITPCTSLGNRNKYFLLLVDDFSRFMWVYIIRSKDQAYEAFCKFKSVEESEFGCKVKALRTDRGGEFTSSRFEQLCSEDGIQRYLTAPYTPQHNETSPVQSMQTELNAAAQHTSPAESWGSPSGPVNSQFLMVKVVHQAQVIRPAQWVQTRRETIAQNMMTHPYKISVQSQMFMIELTQFNRCEAKFIQKIVKEISLKVHLINWSIDEKLIGMETRVRNAISSLEIDSEDDIQMIGIWGMGGAGKTTLARAVFDHISIRFEGKSFVENIREVSKGSLSGLKKLLKQVLKDVLNDQSIDVTSTSDGINKMKKMMPGRKVLVVLDDVDRTEQLEALAGELTWFKPGSRIFITTRDKQVLVAQGVHVDNIYQISLLSREEAICLFSRHAFRRKFPIQGYEELSRKVVHYAAGLPLTIKVLGSFLCGRTEHIWLDTLERLKTIPLEETIKKLEISYDGLEKDYKEIFLDVACILKGEPKHKAIRMLESCGYHAQIGLEVLEQKSLINTLDDGYLGMHDHIEEMGRNIVRRFHPDEPSIHSRLWVEEEIKEILVNDLGTKATRSMNMRNLGICPALAMKSLRKMKELRLLRVFDDNLFKNWEFDENIQYLPDTLRSIYWSTYPLCCLPKTFQANNLVNLEMPWSYISELWEGGEIKHFQIPMLKYFDLSHSKVSNLNIGFTPDHRILNIIKCYYLQEIHVPVGSLKKLTYLNLSGCSRYKNGVDEFVELHMLVECPKLKSRAVISCGA
ncbi:hypothetical protein E3N88_09694 [Mikania micrantha]|uniref:Integrase catalytic domain-containing protein n=1 Tax=Mikania micrantha TaxID=192012 RepID=A0A5N6PKM8_9ASTR|nr:hypothetical protein E3N88_09694 [Mikania micrantha]